MNDYHKKELTKDLESWLAEHRNPYDHDINEKAYWTMHNLLNIVKETNEDNTVGYCQTIFNRFKHYY